MLERVRTALSQSNHPEDTALANALDARIKKLGDIASPSIATQVEEKPLFRESPISILGVFKDLAQEYNTQPHTPELVNKFWQTFLETSIKNQELDIFVPTFSCDRTQEELEALREERRMWIPETKLTYPQLGEIFPEMGRDAVRGVDNYSPIKDKFKQDAKGVDVEVNIAPPNRNTDEDDLKKIFKSQDRKGIRLSTYILASQASKLLNDQYLDEGGVTWSRLLGSCSRLMGLVLPGRVSCGRANFLWSGHLDVDWSLHPDTKGSDLGGRSEGVKKVKKA